MEQMKDKLVHYPNAGYTLAGCIQLYKNIDNWLKAQSEKQN